MNDIHQAAIEAGATVLGDPPHYLFSAEQLAAFLAQFEAPAPLPPCPVQIPPCPCPI